MKKVDTQYSVEEWNIDRDRVSRRKVSQAEPELPEVLNEMICFGIAILGLLLALGLILIVGGLV